MSRIRRSTTLMDQTKGVQIILINSNSKKIYISEVIKIANRLNSDFGPSL